ncbi:MAG: glycosyltransferase family 4 protein [Pirellulales bacterium]
MHLLYGGMGGLSSYLMEFVRSDQDRRFENSVLYFGIESPHDEYVKFCDDHGISHACVMKRRGLDLIGYSRVFGFLVRHRPDVVVVHSATVCPPVFLYGMLGRCRTVFIEHTASTVKTRADWYASRLAQRFADHVVVFYPQQLEELRARLGGAMRPHKITTIAKSVDVRHFRPRQARADVQPSPDDVVIGMQSRLNASRDHATLLRAFASLLREECGSRLQLRIAGDGPTRPGHESLARELGIENRVKFTGTLTRAALSDFLQGLDVYVHASSGETICYAIMEAQAAGLPIVASDVNGINNAIQHGVHGFLFRAGDVEELVGTVKRLVNDRSLREEFGRISRLLMEELARRTNVAEEFYRMLLGGVAAECRVEPAGAGLN